MTLLKKKRCGFTGFGGFLFFFFHFLQKKVKLTALVHEMCSEMSHLVGKFVQGIGRIDEDESGARTTEPSWMGTSKQQSRKRQRQSSPEADSLPIVEESYPSDDEDSDEDLSLKVIFLLPVDIFRCLLCT